MNYFTHALPFLDQPYFAAGTGVPDWLAVADRPVRLRSKQAERFRDHPDPLVAAVARGVGQHLRDDSRFHANRAFVETSLELTVRARDLLDGETGLRPAFLGHLLTELLLDAALIAEDPTQLTRYYHLLEEIDPKATEAAVNQMAARPTERLAVFIRLFLRERILWNYLEDDKLWVRLNQVMRRVRLESLPQRFVILLPEAREMVLSRKKALLDGIPDPWSPSCVTE
jgi:hypothetical protein